MWNFCKTTLIPQDIIYVGSDNNVIMVLMYDEDMEELVPLHFDQYWNETGFDQDILDELIENNVQEQIADIRVVTIEHT